MIEHKKLKWVLPWKESGPELAHTPPEMFAKRLISLTSVLLVIFTGRLFMGSTTNGGSVEWQMIAEETNQVYAFDLPEQMDFCGEEVPLDQEDVRERLERELYINTFWQSNTLLMIKSAARWLPQIRETLRANGVPEDFQYLPMVESAFQHKVSPSGAEGYWQFMPATARNYNLRVDDQVDERYHVHKATLAACRYLKDAYRMFGSWTAVAASYNVGMGGLRGAMKRQDAESYYDLHLNQETGRYVFRLLAIKAIIEEPKRFGFRFRKNQLYQPIRMEQVKVTAPIADLAAWAKAKGINYKILRNANPWLQGYTLNASAENPFVIDLPIDRNLHSLASADTAKALPPTIKAPEKTAADPKPIESLRKDTARPMPLPAKTIHVVVKGETLSGIGKKYGVKAETIMEANDLRDDYIKPGQKLIILGGE